jgi:hypothetical protein
MKRIAFLAAVIVALAVSAPAYGQSATGDAYGHSGGGILGAVDSGNGGGGGGGNAGTSTPAPTQVVAATSTDGSLPFTGMDLGLLALGGVVLLGVGFGLRRVARTQ